jgi:protein-S-isoprenylcysteine O-methyltransferase Ste14
MTVEMAIRLLGGLVALATLAIILYGIWRGARRPVGRRSGRGSAWLVSPRFYFITTAIFLGVSYLGWIPLPVGLSPTLRLAALLIGTLLYFPGLALVLWGRFALERNYFVSSALGAQLFADHQLVTTGPFALVRHPMYLGLALAAVGGLLIYLTWTTLFFACFTPFLWLRARREEKVLAEEFGGAWGDYCGRVPAFIPRLRVGGR